VARETPLVLGAVELDQALVDGPLVAGIEAAHRVGDLAVRVRDASSRPCRLHAEPPSRSSSASCTPVEAPEGTAARRRARLERDLDLDGRVAARVEDLPRVRARDARHVPASLARSK
jgi:hypothetical protein